MTLPSPEQALTDALAAVVAGKAAVVVKAPPGGGKPIQVDEPISMGDGTVKPLRDVRVGDLVVSHTGTARRVTAVHEQGILSLVRITTSQGRVIRAAPDHPFLTPQGWVAAGDLAAGQALAVANEPSAYSALGTERPAEEFRLAGYFVGDGCSSGHGSTCNCEVVNGDLGVLDDAERCAKALGFAAERRHWGNARNASKVVLRNRLGPKKSGGPRQWLRDNGLVAKAATKRVPSFVFSAPPHLVAEFVGAYFSCDGNIAVRSARSFRVEFDSISRGLLGDIQHLLVRLGIASSVFTKVRAHNSRGSYLSYNLRVVIDDVPLFAERVPVYNNFRSARLALVPPSQSFGTAYRADIVVSVEGDGHGECRCLTVEDDETFLVRDVVVHNSRLVEMVASLACAHYDERVGIACQTNAQTHDLTSRILAAYPHLPVALLARAGLILPDHLEAAPNLVVARAMRQLPQGPCIVLGTAAKWSWSDPDVADLDLLIVDEAWQLADWAFSLIAGMADRFLLVGDPGQIAPVVAADVRRWRSDPSGPHLPCPVTLQARRADDVTVVQLPATRRFGPDTVALVQPSFYPDLPFYSVRPPRGFALVGDPLGCSGELLGRLAGGQELVMGELPASATGMNDPELANIAAELTRNVLSFGRVTSPAGAQALTPADVLVVCAHVSQVGEVQAALGPELAGVRVDTAERCQGQEAELVIVWHPLSGRTDPTEFAKDGGRMCVMASRHRVGCVVLCRAGATDALRRSGASNERVLGVEVDPSYNGWRANLTLLDQLRRHDRVVPVTPLAAQSLAAGTGL